MSRSGPVEETTLAQAPEWWQSAVIYEVYPRSFADGDGDGVGDLAGLIARLPYIAALGVDGSWMTPFQPSPQVDQGYDVTDYCGVDPLFGTMEQFDSLLEKAHALGLRILLDVVPNHCSSEHPLFLAALAAGPGSPERDMFHFVPDPLGMSDDGGLGTGVADLSDVPPNNPQSLFAAGPGAAPTRTPRRTGTGTCTSSPPEQPDWNWRNPAVGDYFDGVLRFWFDKGVDGLRIDVAHALFKADGLPDSPSAGGVVDGLRSNPQVSDQEEVHEVYRRWRTLAEKYEPHRLLVGEVNLEQQYVPCCRRRLAQRIADLLSAEQIDDLVVRTRNGGAEVVALLKTGSAYYAPSAAAARMAKAVIEDTGAVMPVCAWVDGEYEGISGVYLGVEAELGREGVRKVVRTELTDTELDGLREAADAVAAKQADVKDL